jgi:hypothetical protein
MTLLCVFHRDDGTLRHLNKSILEPHHIDALRLPCKVTASTFALSFFLLYDSVFPLSCRS